ncbi:TonB-dependent receptor [Sphingomonas oligophenolica]|uniref:TonB-dependent receptor n=2 Tax=Sphingomonas oligophenolica TaxID=301154 RepID=A0ABU9XWW2_9SPHN
MVGSNVSMRIGALAAVSMLSIVIAQQASAQQAAQGAEQAAPEAKEAGPDIVVTGSRIAGTKITAALPVTVLSENDIAATGAVSGDELFRSIPQMGDVPFNSTNGAVSSNFARGDVGSVNLRNLGIGNTLVLLNGRRVVQNPGSQANSDLVPVITYNTNAIPTSGLARLEVLRDGAAALYGTDAVAGVVNTVLRDNIDGGTLDVQYGGAEGTGLREFSTNGDLGRNFAGGRGNISLFFEYTNRTALSSQDQDFTRSADRRPDYVGTAFEGLNTLDRRSTLSSWGDFLTQNFAGAVKQGTTALTTAGGAFSTQPSANGGCQVQLSGGICLDDGNRATSGADRNTRSDATANYPISLIPKLDRLNLYATSHFDINDDLTVFGEFGYYYAKTRSVQDGVFSIGSIPMTIPASNYWNPFGPVTFANGTTNPNRLPGLNIPAAGIPIRLVNYRFDDLGPTVVDVTTQQFRALAGLRGNALGFHWESALLYSEARSRDVQDGISATLLQQQLALSTPDAYNPFNGGNPANPTGPDSSPSSQAALNAIRVKAVRFDKTTLAQWDFRASKADLFALPGGNVGMAFGAEVRRDTQLDDRDPRVDGTITWTDSVTGTVQPSDLYGVSPTPDTRGSRTVAAAYTEFAVPLISPKMGVPLIRNLELQLAGRYEHYSDFGSVAKPKVAAAWDIFDGLRIRGSWAQGFRAPNLEQVNATLVTRGNTRTDYVRCEADLRAGRITNFTQCGRTVVATAQRAGNPSLEPETSDSWTVGAVLQPKLLPESLGRITFTVDYWTVKQKGIVGVFGEGNALIRDYLLRTQGSSDPNVIRLAPTADDVAAFAGTGLAPVGQVLYVKDIYQNLLPQTVRGLDFGFNASLHDTGIGNFSLSTNVAYMIEFYRSPSPGIQALLDARAAGQINAGTIITGGGDQLRQSGLPKWKWSTSLTWSLARFQAGLFTQYTGSVLDTGVVDANGNYPVVDGQMTANLYVQYELGGSLLNKTRIRLGVRNLTNARPPISSGSNGYLGALYEPYRRYWYASVRKEF